METRRLTVEMGLPGGRLHVEMDVPTGVVQMERLLPALRTTADAFVAAAAEQSTSAGKPVSCTKGCGACCRQLVPVAHAEARRIAAMLEELPEPRRAEVKERFSRAVRRVEEAGLLPTLEGRTTWGADRATEIGLDYFRLGIPCPFLEDESCSIYAERPIACREYLVSSDPALCAAAAPEVETVPMPTRVWAAVTREELGLADSEPPRCVPLVLAPRWAAANADPGMPRPGPELLRRVYSRFSRDRSGRGDAA